jgi:hypothetical protein
MFADTVENFSCGSNVVSLKVFYWNLGARCRDRPLSNNIYLVIQW